MSMTTEVFTLGEVATKTGSGKKGPWKLYMLKAQDGSTIGSTFTAAIGGAAEGLIGQAVEVDRFHDGEYFTVKAVRPSNGAPVTPQQPVSAPPSAQVQSTPVGNTYFKPRDPAESRMIRRQVALKAAAQVCAGREVGTQDVLGLAQSFDSWLAREDVATEDVPF